LRPLRVQGSAQEPPSAKCLRLSPSIRYRTHSSCGSAPIDFYKSIGAEPQDEWVRYRMEGESLKHFALGGS
ncbi:hypothetical protein QCD79_32515, partial [Pseudomonas quasicaspiana]|nr:hypothetical protein [Pseudomonas quasicaspiana]